MDRFDEPEVKTLPGRKVAPVNAGGQPIAEYALINMYTMEQRTAHKQPLTDTVWACQHCGDKFNTEHGRKIHVGRAHGDVSDAH